MLEKEQAYNENESYGKTSDGASSDHAEKEAVSKTNSEQQDSKRESDCSGQEAESDDEIKHTYSNIQRKVEAPCQHCKSSNVCPTVVLKCPI